MRGNGFPAVGFLRSLVSSCALSPLPGSSVIHTCPEPKKWESGSNRTKAGSSQKEDFDP